MEYKNESVDLQASLRRHRLSGKKFGMGKKPERWGLSHCGKGMSNLKSHFHLSQYDRSVILISCTPGVNPPPEVWGLQVMSWSISSISCQLSCQVTFVGITVIFSFPALFFTACPCRRVYPLSHASHYWIRSTFYYLYHRCLQLDTGMWLFERAYHGAKKSLYYKKQLESECWPKAWPSGLEYASSNIWNQTAQEFTVYLRNCGGYNCWNSAQLAPFWMLAETTDRWLPRALYMLVRME